jgi:hypothetical protein
LQELWRIETKNGIVEKMFVEEKDVNEIKKIEEKTLNLRNKMIDEQNDPEYVEKKIKEIDKKYKSLDQEYTTFKRESEEDKAKELKVLQKKNKELESDLQLASRSETTIRDQCQAESNRLVQMMRDAQSEIFKLRESQFIEREQRLHLKEKELDYNVLQNTYEIYLKYEGNYK